MNLYIHSTTSKTLYFVLPRNVREFLVVLLTDSSDLFDILKIFTFHLK